MRDRRCRLLSQRLIDGIILREEGRNISPTIYINDMYKKYQDCGDLEETLMAACDFMERAYEQAPVVDVDSIMRDANEKIVFQLINTEQNKTFLEQVPHREFQDLSIVYKVIISADKDAVQSSKITNEFAKRLGMSEEQLFKCAAENTRRLFPPVVRSMNDIMREMFARDGMPQEIADMMIAEIPPEQTMWVISNEKGINGAASMLYENELHELAESLESDLYILPSSVHEVIAVSSDMGSPEMLAQMVVEVNMQEVSLDERLSNQVYHYDKDLRKLTLATDTPNKRLDGIVAEPPLVYDAKKKPYSQVWKYKEDIRKMHKLQEEYLFLVNHDIHSAEELVSVISSLTDKRKEVSAEKSRIYKARERSRELFDIADDMKELEPAEKSFLQGDEFFMDEHLQWETLKQKLLSQGYSLEEVEALRKHYKEEYSKACAKERAVFKELNIGKSIWKSLIPDSVSDGKDAQYNKETIRDRKEQPER